MNSWIKDILLLTLLIGTLFGVCLGKYPLAVPDSARYAEIPREMVATHDYITPHLNGVKYFEKPPLFYWMQAGAIKLFGVHNFAVSLPNALMGLLTCLLIYLAGRKTFNRACGLLSSSIFATSSIGFALVHITTLDMTLTAFFSGCLFCFLFATQELNPRYSKWWFWSMYAFSALAVMTKGLVGMVLPIYIVFFYVLICNDWRNLKNYRLISGVLIFLCIAVPWHILVQMRNPEFWHFYFVEQHFLRYLTNYAGRTQHWWFFPLVFILGFYPWTLFLPGALAHTLPRSIKNRQQNKSLLFLLLWSISIYVFYSFSNSKLIPYLLPVFPPLAIIVGKFLSDNWHTKDIRSINIAFKLFTFFNIVAGIGILIATNFINLQNQSISKDGLLIIATILLLSGITSMAGYYRKGVAYGVITLLIGSAMTLLSLNPILTVANNQSIQPLMHILKTHLSPNDEVVSYGSYHQDLPFYTQRIITVVNYHGELDFGMRHQDTSSWMIDTNKFWQRWNSEHRMFMLVNKEVYPLLLQIAPTKMFVLDKHINDVLVTNQK